MERENINSTWRVAQNSCWTQIPLGQYGTVANPTPDFALVPCDSAECCYSGMRVCRMTDGSVVVTPLNYSVSDPICDPASMSYQIFISFGEYYTSWAECEFTCDWMFGIGGTYNEKPIFSFDDKEADFKNQNFEIEFFNYGDLLNLKVNSQVESNYFKLQLQSIEGRIIEERINQLKFGVNEFPITLSNLNNGVYMLNVFESGQHIITRKIIITR